MVWAELKKKNGIVNCCNKFKFEKKSAHNFYFILCKHYCKWHQTLCPPRVTTEQTVECNKYDGTREEEEEERRALFTRKVCVCVFGSKSLRLAWRTGYYVSKVILLFFLYLTTPRLASLEVMTQKWRNSDVLGSDWPGRGGLVGGGGGVVCVCVSLLKKGCLEEGVPHSRLLSHPLVFLCPWVFVCVFTTVRRYNKPVLCTLLLFAYCSYCCTVTQLVMLVIIIHCKDLKL